MTHLKTLLASTALVLTGAVSASAADLDTQACFGIEAQAGSGLMSMGSDADAKALACARLSPTTNTNAGADGTISDGSDADQAALTAAQNSATTNTGASADGTISMGTDADQAAIDKAIMETPDDAYQVDLEDAFLGNPVVASDGVTVGTVVEVRKSSNGLVRIFVDVEDSLNTMAERAVFTTANAGTADGMVNIGGTSADFTAMLNK